MRSIVDLPQPEGPSRAQNSPLPTARSMSRIAATAPKRLLTAAQLDVVRGPLPGPAVDFGLVLHASSSQTAIEPFPRLFQR